jgi:Nucleotidyl transferase AbiEii toxin, Type IV TA system
MDAKEFQRIKQLIVIAFVSNDELLERLVLKGGNAIDLIYNVSERASIDIDFSMESEFDKKEIERIREIIDTELKETFKGAGYNVFEVTISEKPRIVSKEMLEFWGGYLVEFKIIKKSNDVSDLEDKRRRRMNAETYGSKNKRNFKVEISKFEYCQGRQKEYIDDFTVFVYTPEMIIFEKLRAICQKTDKYLEMVKSKSKGARARDFFDIYVMQEKYKIDFFSEENTKMLSDIFKAKKVPLELLDKIEKDKDFHKSDFDSVRQTINTKIDIKDFDFYFNYVIEIRNDLKPLWNK